jgi:hypothetical protein
VQTRRTVALCGLMLSASTIGGCSTATRGVGVSPGPGASSASGAARTYARGVIFGPLTEAMSVLCPGAPPPARRALTSPEPGLTIQVFVAKDGQQAQATVSVPAETSIIGSNAVLHLDIEHSLGPHGQYRFYACDR